MARCQEWVLAGMLLGGAMTLPTAVAAAPPGTSAGTPPGVVPAQYYYQPERRYAPAPRRRRVCWTERSRIFVGRDNWGRPLYRVVPRRVCRWRYY